MVALNPPGLVAVVTVPEGTEGPYLASGWTRVAETTGGAAEAAGAAPAVSPPPRSGRGASRAAWVAYAEHVGVAVPDDANREDVVDAVEAAGHPVD